MAATYIAGCCTKLSKEQNVEEPRHGDDWVLYQQYSWVHKKLQFQCCSC